MNRPSYKKQALELEERLLKALDDRQYFQDSLAAAEQQIAAFQAGGPRCIWCGRVLDDNAEIKQSHAAECVKSPVAAELHRLRNFLMNHGHFSPDMAGKAIYHVHGTIPLSDYDAYLVRSDGHNSNCAANNGYGEECDCGWDEYLDSEESLDEFAPHVVDVLIEAATPEEAKQKTGVDKAEWGRLIAEPLKGAHHFGFKPVREEEPAAERD